MSEKPTYEELVKRIQELEETESKYKKTVEALRESEEKYRILFEMVSDANFLIDKNTGNILEVNSVASKIYGFTREEFLKMKNTDVSAEPERTYGATHDKLTGIPLRYHKKKDGTVIPVEIAASHLIWKGQEAHIASIRDISFRIEAEKERERLKKQLDQVNKLNSLGTLAGGIAHDFNNILSSIIGFTELALDDVEKDSNIENSLQEVYAAGKRAKDLVKQILVFARQSDEELKPIRIDSIVKEALKFIRSSIPTTIDIKTHIKSDSLVMGNPTQVHQVLMNLCTNAAQAMDDNGGMLEVSLKDVAIGNNSEISRLALKSGNYVEIKVSDTGPGISPDIIGSIFEPYFTTKGPGEGTGMGLAMVHGIVERYSGKTMVESELGEGTIFTIYLPVTKQDRAFFPYEAEALSYGSERILFVDDEVSIAKMGCQLLERMGYSVTARTSSIEALELFKTKPDNFDLVVTDMTMPDMTGDVLAIELMKIRPDIPVVLCTGYSKKITEDSASDIGIKAFVYKPITRVDLTKTVRKVLDRAKA